MADQQTIEAMHPATTTEPSQKPSDPASQNSEETGIDWPWGLDPYDEGEPSLGEIRVGTWRSRFRRALHMSSGIREGYSDDLRINPKIVSLDHRQVGYPKVAGFQDCDRSLQIFRKFGWLHFRSLLSLQDELAELEKTMRRLDRWEFADGDFKNLLSRRRDDQQPESARQEVAAKIKNKLAEYDELLLRSQKVQAMKGPSSRAQLTLFNLIRNTESLVADESEFIRYSPNLAALVPGDEQGRFNHLLEEALNFFSQSFTKAIFRSKEQAQQTGDEELVLVDYQRMNILFGTIFTIFVLSLLLIPLFVLRGLQPSKISEVRRQSIYQLLAIFVFTLVFAASVRIFTRAKRQEVFQATAAYIAILVIYLGNVQDVIIATDGLLNQTPS